MKRLAILTILIFQNANAAPEINLYVLSGEMKLQDDWTCTEWKGTNVNGEPECSEWGNTPTSYYVAQDKFNLPHMFRLQCVSAAITIDKSRYVTRNAEQCHFYSEVILKSPKDIVLVIDEANSTLINVLKADEKFKNLWEQLLKLSHK